MDGGGGQGERGSYIAAVDGQEQEGQWAVIPYQGPESRHIQAKVLWGQRGGGLQVSLPWVLLLTPNQTSTSREPSLVRSSSLELPLFKPGGIIHLSSG